MAEKRRSAPAQDSINQFQVINCKGNRLQCPSRHPSTAICHVMSMGRGMTRTGRDAAVLGMARVKYWMRKMRQVRGVKSDALSTFLNNGFIGKC